MKQNVFKWVMVFLVMVQMVFSYSTTTVFAKEDDEPPVDKNSLIPEVKLINGPVFDITAGTSNEIIVKLRNVSSFGARNVIVQPTITDVSSNPFKITFQEGMNKFSTLAGGGEREFNLTVDADKTAESKTHSITLNYTFFNTYGLKFTGTDTMYFKIKNTSASPKFTIEDFKVEPKNLSPGDAAVISATIINPGPVDIFNANLLLNGLKPEEISINNGMDSIQLNEIPAGTRKDFSFNIIANANMNSGSYPVDFKLTYKDDTGKDYDLSQKFYINIGGTTSEKKPILEIKNMAEPSDTYGVNENFSITFSLFNSGEQTAKNIKVSATGVGETAAVVPKSSSIQTIKELPAGKSQPVEFIFAATSASKTQNYPIEFTVEYEDGTKKEGVNTVVTFKQYAGANVFNPEADKKEEEEKEKQSKPKIIISEYKSNPLIVMAGQEFDLTMTFLNTHAEKAVKNVKVFLTLAEETTSDTQKTGNIFTPVDSSNTFYFDSIASKGSVNKKVRLFVVPDAQPKTYTLTVNFEYEDAEKNEYTATELLGINVKQTTKLEIDDFALPPQVESGMPVNFSFNYANTGKVILNNLKIKIDGNVESQNKGTYIGNLESGQSDYFEAEFTPTAEGETPVSITISYDDPSGETIEEKRDFVLNVVPPAPIDPSMEGMNPEGMDDTNQATKIDWKLIGIGASCTIVVAIAIVAFVKKRKRKAEEAFLAMDEEDEIVQNMTKEKKGSDTNEHL